MAPGSRFAPPISIQRLYALDTFDDLKCILYHRGGGGQTHAPLYLEDHDGQRSTERDTNLNCFNPLVERVAPIDSHGLTALCRYFTRPTSAPTRSLRTRLRRTGILASSRILFRSAIETVVAERLQRHMRQRHPKATEIGARAMEAWSLVQPTQMYILGLTSRGCLGVCWLFWGFIWFCACFGVWSFGFFFCWFAGSWLISRTSAQ